MRKKIWLPLSLILLTLLQCGTAYKPRVQKTDGAPEVLRQPAEFEPQDCIWLIWPPVDHKEGYSAEVVTLQIITALIPHTRVVVTAATPDLYKKAKATIPAAALENGRVELLLLPSEQLWARDMGPVFVQLRNGKKAIVNFGFNAWGYTPENAMDESTIRMEKYDAAVAELRKLPLISTDLISEGGNRELNGKGVLMLVQAVEQGRNPRMTKAAMEGEFRRLLGVKKVIWLKEGLHEDDHTFRGTLPLANGTRAYTVATTNGHIDEFARFVNDSTILLAEVPAEDLHEPVARENHRRLEENYAILEKATDQDGRPFRIIRMPTPHQVPDRMKPGDSVYDFISTLDYKDGSVFPVGATVQVIPTASYLNFLITDKVVIGQKYWREGLNPAIKLRDETARSILEDVFPGRTILLLDALAINFGGGGIHCITIQEPKF
jgi:agmatine deiminase